jgi:hypothetical protein
MDGDASEPTCLATYRPKGNNVSFHRRRQSVTCLARLIGECLFCIITGLLTFYVWSFSIRRAAAVQPTLFNA